MKYNVDDIISRKQAQIALVFAEQNGNLKVKDMRAILEVLDLVPAAQTWVPVNSKKLPDERDWYLGIFKEPDTGWINPVPFVCDYVGKDTNATTKEGWILRGITDTDNIDGICDYYKTLECVAWSNLPTPYDPELVKECV